MMVSQKKAFQASALSAILIGAVHGAAHYVFGDPASFADAAVTPVGITVVVAAFLIAYVGMRWNK